MRLNSSVTPCLEFSAPPRRSLRLRGKCIWIGIHRRDAEVAETTQKKTENREPLNLIT